MEEKKCPRCGVMVREVTADGFHLCLSCNTLFSDFAISKAENKPAYNLPMEKPLWKKNTKNILITLLFFSLPVIIIALIALVVGFFR
jgi:hypothetical protein